MRKRQMIAVIFLLMALTACKNNDNENTESVTVSITAEEPAPEAVTEQTEKELHGLGDYTEATVSEKKYEPVIIQGKEYDSGDNIWLDMELKYDDGSYWDITDTDVENLNSFDNVELYIYNSGSRDLHFLESCKTVTSLTIYNLGEDVEGYLEIFKKMPLGYLYVDAENTAYSRTAADFLKENLPFCNVYYSTPSFFTIDMETGPEQEAIDIMNRLDKVQCTIENCGNSNLDFLKECKTVAELQLNEFSGKISDYIDLFKQMELEILTVNSVNFSEVDSTLLMKEMPYCEITYAQDVDVSFTNSNRNDACFFVNPILVFGYDYSTWYDDAERWQTWNEHLCMRLCNFTKEEVTAESLEIYHNNNDIWEQVKFKNGEDILPLDITLEPEHFPNNGYIDSRDYNYILSDEDMDYSLLSDGRYKAVVKFNDGEYEMEFFVRGKDNALDFLTPEQAEVLRKGNNAIGEYLCCSHYLPEGFDKENKTYEDFYNEYLSALTYEYAYELSVGYYIKNDGSWRENIGGDRGGDISYTGKIFFPVFSDDSVVIIKSVNIYSHGDIPFEIWYEEYNFRMVKTEEGWKLDSARTGF